VPADLLFRMKILYIFLFFILAVNIPVNAENNEIERMVLNGLDHCYHFRWEKGGQTFEKIIKKYPEDPRGYHYQSTVYLWYYLSTKDKEDYENFMKYSNLAIKKADKILDKNKSNEDIKYILGTTYSCRAMIFAKAGNYLDAVWASKSSESLLKEVVKSNPENYDAYLGLGLYNFAVGQIPSAFKWALNLAGISGDEKTGLAYISKTAEKGTFSRVEAQFYLSQILTEVKLDYGSGGEYLRRIAGRYPENLLFNYSLGVLEIKKRNLDLAEKYISKVIKADNEKFVQLNAFSNFLMGDILFRKNKFEEAVAYYREFLTNAMDVDYTGIASYRLGICLEMINERENAVFYFKRSLKGNTDLDDDVFAKRKGALYIDQEMTDEEKSLIRFANLIEAGKYKQASDSLQELLNERLTEKVRSEVYLHLSEASFQIDSTDESIAYAVKAIELYTGDEKWIKPFANYYAARACHKTGNIELMKNYIEEAESFGGYDYSNRLENLLKTLTSEVL
jgi:tetratricopeptide (TPR) repeat protein